MRSAFTVLDTDFEGGQLSRSRWQRGKGTQPRFARLVSAAQNDDAISVRVGDVEIRVRRGLDGELLRAVVAALGAGEA